MLMIDGPLQILCYALPPNSELLFSEPGNAPLFEAFDGPVFFILYSLQGSAATYF